jgi:hypothetical protein
MTREKIKLIPGVPFMCTLETSEGKPMTSRFHDGAEYLYSVNHRGAPSMLYLPVEGHMAIKRLGVRAGDEIQIVKTQTQGQAPEFSVRTVSDATLAVPALPPATQQPWPALERDNGVRMLAPRSQVAPLAPAAPPPPPAQYPPVRGFADETPQPGSVMLGQCLLAAIDAAIGAERYALAKGKTLSFAPEDIRAMGLSVYIGKQREGR